MKSFKKVLVLTFTVIGLAIVLSRPALALSRRALLDINRDGVISLADKKAVQDNLGMVNPTGVNALADVNQDGTISGQDLSAVVKEIGQTVSNCEIADITNDGVFNYDDLNIVGNYYFQETNSVNMMADLTGDGFIDILDLAKMGGLFGCTW